MSTTRFQSWLYATAVGAYMAASGAAIADDTEVFFTQEYRDTSKPNILFILDTSGSMGDRPASSSSSGPVKMDIVKSSMRTLLDGMTNVNVGLARFTVPGGPILMPVKDIDLPADPLISTTISGSDDDAEESTAGAVNISNNDLDLVEESGAAKWVAIRFSKVDIPQGATVSKAAVSLAALENGTGTVNLEITAQAADNAPVFTTAANNLSSRTRTSANAVWSITSNWTAGERYTSVDIAPVIQEVVNRSGWCGGNSLVVLIRRSGSGTTKRVAYNYDSLTPTNSTYYPKLNVQFSGTLPSGAGGCYTAEVVSTVEGATDDVEQSGNSPFAMTTASQTSRFKSSGSYKAIGLRFPRLRVPQNATIVDSYVKFRNNTGSSYTGTTTVNVQGINEGNFGGWSQSSLVVNSGLTGTTLSKTAAVSVTIPDWLNNSTVSHSGNINSVISAVTSRADWASGNALGLVMTYVSGAEKRASTYEGKVPATLTVRYRGVFATGTYTVRDDLKVATEQLVATGSTPLSDTMLEAGLYYRGEDVVYGVSRRNNANNRVSNPNTDTMSVIGSHTIPTGCDPLLDPLATACAGEALTGTWKYKSPITDTCEDNFIVFLTDGAPTSHNVLTETNYTRMAGAGNTCSAANSGSDCLVKLSSFYFNRDQSSALQGTQNIKSYFIGFDVDLPLLNQAAAAGGTTTSKLATDATSLASSLSDILDDINIRTNTFVTAGVTVNQTNRLTHLDQLYFSIFAPDITPRWAGNLKRYKLGSDGELYDSQTPEQLAVDPGSDQFLESAQSWWSGGIADGNDPKKGGVASHLSVSRSLYTNVSGTSNTTLIAANNLVHEGNPDVTESMLSVVGSTEREQVLQWARGMDVMDEDNDGITNEANHVFGDPLHSRPALVNYDDGTTEGMLRVYVGTNRGELHSIDTTNGNEQWAFVPTDLLPHYNVLMQNTEATAKPYGLDASVVSYIKDVNGDGKVNATAGDKAYLYIGMRRGGRNYYALDVSDPAAPILKFIIAGGVGSYGNLAQTWSQPVIAKAKIGSGAAQTVMIFGGGYDTAQDSDGAPVNDADGNTIYIANADTGALLWSSDQISGLGMNKSIPSDVAAVDLNGDGLVDHIYAADMGAQIWRFDLRTDGTITGGKLASFQDTATEQDNRRFYGGVDVGLIQRNDGSRFVVVAAGSGFRERPLNRTIDEHFYVFRDEGVFGNSITPVALTDLADITNLLGDTDPDDAFDSDALEAIETGDKLGWYYQFGSDGEKSLTAPVIFNNAVLFTTYVPPSQDEINADCGGAAGTGRFYAMSVLDGNPIRDTDGDGLENTDRFVELPDCPTCGFVPPQLLFTDDNVVGLVGTKGVDIESLRDRVKRAKWRHNQ